MKKLCTFHLPEQVLAIIMAWLPPESLFPFKCVCKSWYTFINSLVNDPKFVTRHLHNMNNWIIPTSKSIVLCYSINYPNKAKQLVSLLTICDTDNHIIRDFNILGNKEKMELHSHCNGNTFLADFTNSIVLSNSSIKQFKNDSKLMFR